MFECPHDVCVWIRLAPAAGYFRNIYTIAAAPAALLIKRNDNTPPWYQTSTKIVAHDFRCLSNSKLLLCLLFDIMLHKSFYFLKRGQQLAALQQDDSSLSSRYMYRGEQSLRRYY